MQATAPPTRPRWQSLILSLGLHGLVLGALAFALAGPELKSSPLVVRLVALAKGPVPASRAPLPAAAPTPPARAAHPHHPATPTSLPAPLPAVAAAAPRALPQPPTADAGLPAKNPAPVLAAVPEVSQAPPGAGGAPHPGASPARGGSVTDGADARADYLHQPEVDYPWLAKRQNLEGVARVGVQVGSDGRAENVWLVHSSGVPVLDEEAERAIRACHDCFRPPVRDGRPVPGKVVAPVVFALSGN